MYSLDDLRSSYALLDYRSDHGESIADIFAEVGLRTEDVMFIAEQRGLRAALVATGEREKLSKLIQTSIPLPIRLTPEQVKFRNITAACEMEGIAATLMMVKRSDQ